MLKLRVIPVLLLQNGRMVKTTNFGSARDAGSPSSNVKVFNAQGADELIFLNIEGSADRKHAFYDIIKNAAAEAFMPFTVGGGVSSLEDISNLLELGADKVSLNSIAIQNLELLETASRTFGRNCIVVSIDVKKVDGRFFVFSNGGKVNTGLDPVSFAKKCEQFGAGEILLTSIDAQGTMQGYDLQLLESVINSTTINVIPNGGVGKISHFDEVIKRCGTNALGASSIYHFTDQNIIKVKSYLRSRGYEVRQW